ncbi:patatin-like phospholipase family protein [Pontibacter cellulosilyticus]|uniref:Patatin-like phospholipase family protein n=1 Tax=Pontibacter cellulosilyticus TaxID=1720253 RepID=A0A923N4C7_9BACT|nr:patatin-like phospholipase family protein [Pontibacter cellulosilyticus]MBC5991634.1 patatin-like phospholipase family protein [Pontibacter cellulosilyticus]
MRIGLALSGGGARGIAHLGVLKAFDELGIKISMISGVSSGAIAGVLYAAGYTPDQILKLIKELSVFKIVRPAFGKAGFLHLEEVEKLYINHLGPHIRFEDLKIPVVVSATEMNEGVTAYFSSGELIKPLLASSAVPILYQPILYQGKVLNDGGLLNNMPVDPLHKNCDIKIGVHVNPINHQAKITNIRSMIERTLLLAINNNVKLRMPLCDLLIEPPELKYYRLTNFRKADEIFDIGYRYTLKLEKNIWQLLNR